MSSKVVTGSAIKWYHTLVSLPAKPKGVHKVTPLFSSLPFLKKIKIGTMNIFIQHTSASLAVNECPDESVRNDLEMMLNRLVPEDAPYTHTIDGIDDMPAHVKAVLIGSSVTVPILNGKIDIGKWQGILLCEHRYHGGSRNCVVTVQGCEE